MVILIDNVLYWGDIGDIVGEILDLQECNALTEIVGELGVGADLRALQNGATNVNSFKFSGFGQLPGVSMNLATKESIPHRISYPLIDVACGYQFMMAFARNGFLSWGNNDFGQLGLGDYVRRDLPVFSQVDGHVIAMSCGDSHAMMLIFGYVRGGRGNRLFGWGCNRCNCLGLKYMHAGTSRDIFNNIAVPQSVEVDDVSSMVCGDDYSLILARGCLWVCRDIDEPGGCGIGPHKLEINGSGRIGRIIGMFACCYQYVFWTETAMYVHGICSSEYCLIPGLRGTMGVSWKCGDDLTNDARKGDCDVTTGIRLPPDFNQLHPLRCDSRKILARGDLSGIKSPIVRIVGTDEFVIVVTYGGVYALFDPYSDDAIIPVLIYNSTVG
jgi:hypothetical protein